MVHWVLKPIFGQLITAPPEECGERMLSLASHRYPPRSVNNSPAQSEVTIGTDGKPGSGVYVLTWNGEKCFKMKAYEVINDRQAMKEKVWAHTWDSFDKNEVGTSLLAEAAHSTPCSHMKAKFVMIAR